MSFPVHDVVPGLSKFETVKTPNSIDSLLQRDDRDKEKEDRTEVIYCSEYNSSSLAHVYCHPLIAAVHTAFSQHMPLTLSPDIIWITILQGFAQHIRLNSEKYRSSLVDHKGRMKLSVDAEDIFLDSPESAWDKVVEGLENQLHWHTRNDSRALVSDFSTTSAHERLASSVVILDAYQSYFEYEIRCMCGIPEITLTGDLADWMRLRKKLDLMKGYQLEWWLDSVREICDQFVRAAAGEVKQEFWRDIYKKMSIYGGEVMNGWLLKLIPYIRSHDTGSFTARNPLLKDDSWDDSLDLDDPLVRISARPNGVTSASLPMGISLVPFSLELPGGRHQMQLLGGFLGVEQDSQTLAIKPRVGWAVRKAPPLEVAFSDFPDECVLRPALSSLDFDLMAQKIVNRANCSAIQLVSGDLLSFYRKANGLRYRDLSILGLEEVSYFPITPDDQNSMLWLKVGEYDDGTFLAVETSFHTQKVYHVSPHGAYVMAASFRDFIGKLKSNQDS